MLAAIGRCGMERSSDEFGGSAKGTSCCSLFGASLDEERRNYSFESKSSDKEER